MAPIEAEPLPAPIVALEDGSVASGRQLFAAVGARACQRRDGDVNRRSAVRPALATATACLLVGLGACGDAVGPTTASQAFAAVSAGAGHTCAVALDGTGYCWGRGVEGQLGDGRRQDASAPVRVAISVRLTAIAAGDRHTCALAADGSVLCWGWNGNGQLGNASTQDAATPVTVASNLRFAVLTAGARHTCAATNAGAAYCWGGGGQGQLGNGSRADAGVPTAVTAGSGLVFGYLAAGGTHTCGLTPAGKAYCWGANDVGQLGTPATGPSLVPAAVQGSIVFRQISSGPTHTCAVTAAGQAYCWGSNVEGELGLRSVDPVGLPGSAVPAAVTQNVYEGIRFNQISAGLHYTCAVATDGKVYCWGRADEGQIGLPSLQSAATPHLVIMPDGEAFASASAGPGTHTCALTPFRGVYCWGSGAEGALGTPGSLMSTAPARVTVP